MMTDFIHTVNKATEDYRIAYIGLIIFSRR